MAEELDLEDSDDEVSSSYGTRPSQLKSPIQKPKAPPVDDMAAFFASAPKAQAEPQAAAQAASPTDDMASFFSGSSPEAAAPKGPAFEVGKTVFGDTDSVIGGNMKSIQHQAPFLDQIAAIPTQARASFAMSDKETRQVLTDSYGKENIRPVKNKKGEIYDYEVKVGDSWFEFKTQMGGDVGKLARPLAETAISIPISAFASLTPAGPVAGLAVGGVAGLRYGDKIAEKWLGIEQDPMRNKALEATIAGVANTVIPLFGGFVSKRLAQRELMKKQGMTEAKILSTESTQFIDDAAALKDKGIVQNIPGTDTPYLLTQAHPDNAELQVIAKSLAGVDELAMAMKQQGAGQLENATKLLRQAADLGDKALVRDEALPSVITSIATETRRAEGREIGKYKMLASKNLGANPQPVSQEVIAQTSDLISTLGFTREQLRSMPAKIPSDVVDATVGKMGLANEAQARDMIRTMKSLSDDVANGAMTLQQFDSAVTEYGARLDVLQKKGGPIAASFGKVVSQLRENRRAAITAGLEGSDKEAFNATMDKFKNTLDASDGMARALNDEFSADVFMKKILDGDKALHQFRSAKALLAKDHPEVWQKLKAAAVAQMLEVAENPSSRTKLNSEKFLGELTKRGQLAKELFDNAGGIEDVKMMFRFGKRIENTDITKLSGGAQKDLVSEGVSLLGRLDPQTAKSSYLFTKQIFAGQEKEAFQIMTKAGIDEFLSRTPKALRPGLKTRLQTVMAYAKMAGTKITPTTYGEGGAQTVQKMITPQIAEPQQEFAPVPQQ